MYAIGEAASTGLHGANRLASNSLLECVVSAYELADYLSFNNLETPKIIDKAILDKIELYSKPINDIDYNINELKSKLKDIMWNKVGIIRNATDLEEALDMIQELKRDFKRERKCLNIQEYEYRNMLTSAEIVTRCALERKESRGSHARSDFKQTNENAEHSSIIKTENMERVYAG